MQRQRGAEVPLDIIYDMNKLMITASWSLSSWNVVRSVQRGSEAYAFLHLKLPRAVLLGGCLLLLLSDYI